MWSRTLDIERCALAAWPAEDVEHVDGWHLRAMQGISLRANSVWTSSWNGGRASSERIHYAEAFYRVRGLRPAFQMTPVTGPPGLADELAARGYVIDAPTSVQTARCRSVARHASTLDVRVTPGLNDAWFGISGAQGRWATAQPTYRALLGRLGPRARYALAYADGQPAAVGLGVLAPRWMGISSMFTLPGFRRRGAARAILRALAAEATRCGVTGVYLQVEEENTGARALYRAATFTEHHVYHYRVASPVA